MLLIHLFLVKPTSSNDILFLLQYCSVLQLIILENTTFKAVNSSEPMPDAIWGIRSISKIIFINIYWCFNCLAVWTNMPFAVFWIATQNSDRIMGNWKLQEITHILQYKHLTYCYNVIFSFACQLEWIEDTMARELIVLSIAVHQVTD